MRKFIFLSVFIFSCSNNAEKVPATILQKDKMVKLMVAIHMAEAAQQQKVLEQSGAVADTISYMEVFKEEQVTKAQYDSAMVFYSAHPQLLDQVYDEVINELNKMQSAEMKKK